MNLLAQNFFALFHLPERFSIDLAKLEYAYREIQKQVHPDRHVNAADTHRRLALQWAAHANEGYRTLRDPITRARYLCQLRGIDTQDERNTQMPAEFLIQQIEWREALAHAQGEPSALGILHSEISTAKQFELNQITSQLDQTNDTPGAYASLRKLMFIEKFFADIESDLSRLAPLENGKQS